MNRRYPFLATLIGIFNVLGIICLVLSGLSLLMILPGLMQATGYQLIGMLLVPIVILILGFVLLSVGQFYRLMLNAAGDLETIARNTEATGAVNLISDDDI